MRLPLLLLALIPMSGAALQSPSTRPSEAPAGKGFVAIAAGAYHSLALRGDGSLVAWGWNDYGQTDVPEGDDFVAIAAGHFHSLALRKNGSVAMWGVNPIGQFLDPDARLQEPAGGDFIGVAASNSNRYEYHSLALRAGRNGRCLGHEPLRADRRALQVPRMRSPSPREAGTASC